jgi:hypothetical protein
LKNARGRAFSKIKDEGNAPQTSEIFKISEVLTGDIFGVGGKSLLHRFGEEGRGMG